MFGSGEQRMNRLVIAIVILLGVLLGLRVISSSSLQRNSANQVGTTPATRTTGFSTEVRNNPTATQAAPQTTQQPAQTAQPATVQQPATTTPLPPQTQPAVRGSW